MKNFLYLIFILSLSTGCSNSTWNRAQTMGIFGGGAGGYSAYAIGYEMVGSEYGITALCIQILSKSLIIF